MHFCKPINKGAKANSLDDSTHPNRTGISHQTGSLAFARNLRQPVRKLNPANQFEPGPGSGGELFSDENFVGAGRYPFLVRMWYFFRCSPTSFTLMARQPRFGLACG